MPQYCVTMADTTMRLGSVSLFTVIGSNILRSILQSLFLIMFTNEILVSYYELCYYINNIDKACQLTNWIKYC